MSLSQEWRSPLHVVWSPLERGAFRFFAPFILLFIITLPYSYSCLPETGMMLRPVTSDIASWMGHDVLRLTATFTSELLSDSTGLYIHTLVLALISLTIAVVWSILDRERLNYVRGLYWLVVVTSYFLSLHLMLYGFDKIFKVQFYLPEPNTLFTRVGQMPRDLLYWSVMGSSRPYSIFTGSLEVIAGLLLLFRRTRLLGGLVAFGLMLNIVAINFAFDISVKVHSLFLLLLSIIVMTPYTTLLRRLVGMKPVEHEAKEWYPGQTSRTQEQVTIGVKTGIIFLLLLNVLAGYITSGNFNDDRVPRPPLHGAYQVTKIIRNGRELAMNRSTPIVAENFPIRWRHLFVHRRGYAIIETPDGEMIDYRMKIDTSNRGFLLVDDRDGRERIWGYEKESDSTLIIWGDNFGEKLRIELKQINLDHLPLLQNEFHWTVDREEEISTTE